MMVIIEGMDNSGKSSLIDKLLPSYPFSVIHSRTYWDEDPDHWVKGIQEVMEAATRRDIFCDRFPVITESVYGPVLRGKNVLSDHPSWPDLLQELARVQPVIIYCRPPLHKLVQWGTRGQMDGVKERALDLIAQYDRVMKAFKNVCTYDYTQPLDLYKVYNEIERGMKNGQH